MRGILIGSEKNSSEGRSSGAGVKEAHTKYLYVQSLYKQLGTPREGAGTFPNDSYFYRPPDAHA